MYPDSVAKVMSLMELSGSIGSCLGPFLSVILSYMFGLVGPFIFFGKQ